MVLVHAPTRLHHQRDPSPALRPNPARVLAMAGTVLLNGIVLMALMQPMKLQFPARQPSTVLVDIRDPAPLPPAPPPQVTDEPEVVPIQPPPTVARRDPTPAIIDSSPPAADPAALPDPTAFDPLFGQSPPGPPDSGVLDRPRTLPTGPVQGVQLSYARASAPPYPRSELRAGAQGTVLLKILVDTDGTPLSVDIHQSSGNPRLDQAARRHVRGHWRFHPAERDGQPVQAIGIVPIDFRLD